MRILHVLDTLDQHPGLFAVTFPGMMAALRARGFECEAVAGMSHDEWVRTSLSAEGVAVVDEDDDSAVRAAVLTGLVSANVVHIHTAVARVAQVAAESARSAGVPYVISPYGEMVKALRGRGRLALWLENRRFRKRFGSRALMHCVSDEEVRLLKSRGIRNDSVVLPLGMDPDAGLRPPTPSDIEPVSLPWTDGRRTFAYFGDIDGRLGLVDFFRACETLGSALDGWRVIVAGRPINNWLETLQEGVRRRGKEHLGEFVVYPDVSQQLAILDAAEFVAVPATAPIAPVSALWAMARERPVLVTPASGLDGCQGRGVTVVDGADRDGMAAALRRFVAMSPAELQQEGALAASCVRNELAWSRVIDGYIDLYEGLVRKAM